MTDDEYATHMTYEANTVAVEMCGKRYTIADLRNLFDLYAQVDHWKDAIDVTLDVTLVDVVGFCRAVEWFQGDSPHVVNAGTNTTVRVTSRGCVC